jgi:hypothetical protein
MHLTEALSVLLFALMTSCSVTDASKAAHDKISGNTASLFEKQLKRITMPSFLDRPIGGPASSQPKILPFFNHVRMKK